MTTAPRALLAGLALLLALPALAEARPLKTAKPSAAAARVQDRAAVAASAGFTARMSRLDALMGTSAAGPRTRSANAEY